MDLKDARRLEVKRTSFKTEKRASPGRLKPPKPQGSGGQRPLEELMEIEDRGQPHVACTARCGAGDGCRRQWNLRVIRTSLALQTF